MNDENLSNDLVETQCKKKKCFVITPIGNDNSEIRRHADGIFDECIKPLLYDKYEVTVAHRLSKPGSITNQVLQLIFESELVIADLTGLNPNVMYELAFRHCLRKPVIQIMEDNELKLPFDITTDRTIFYKNDIHGAYELKNRLKEMIKEIEKMDIKEVDNPIFNLLTQINVKNSIVEENTEKVDVLNYILDNLNELNSKINYTSNLHKNTKFQIKKPLHYKTLESYTVFIHIKINSNLSIDEKLESIRRVASKYFIHFSVEKNDDIFIIEVPPIFLDDKVIDFDRNIIKILRNEIPNSDILKCYMEPDLVN